METNRKGFNFVLISSSVPDPNIFLLGEFLEENFVNFLGLLRLVGVGVDGGHLAVHLVLVVTLHRLLQHLCNNHDKGRHCKLQSCGSGSQGAYSLPLPLHVEKTGKNNKKSFDRGNYPPPYHWDRREI